VLDRAKVGVYAVAEAPARLSVRLGQDGVARIVRDAGAEAYLRAPRLW
jgi:hypothetical protein